MTTQNAAFWARPDLRSLVRCPKCKGQIAWQKDRGDCAGCFHTYPVEDGIPILIQDTQAATHDEIEHEHFRHNREQASYFDSDATAEFERERPHATPELHAWLLGRKFLLGTQGLRDILVGATVLVVCGGSGMDGEFLARAGARVITSDISLGAARRAAERAKKYGLTMASVVADIEALPLERGGIDLAYVHDGLHHLSNPDIGLAEMVRVAGRAIAVSEPAKAQLTQLAIRLGLALEFEEAGNRVERLRPQAIAASLENAGLRIVKAQRYAMFYRHYPGSATHFLSLPGLVSLAKLAALGAIRVSGHFGNKLTVQAVRDRGGAVPRLL